MGNQPSADAQLLLAAALRHHQAGRLDQAEPLYRRILAVDPAHADALHLLGVLCHQRGRHASAIELIRKAIGQNARTAAYHNNLGNAHQALGQWDEAVSSYRQALARKPDHADAHYNLGVVYQAQDRLEEAAASYASALARKPDHAEAHGNLGNVFQALGRLPEAQACYERALRHKPNFAQAHSNLGNVQKAQGDLAQAAASYGHALRLEPGFAEAHHNFALLHLEQGVLAEAAASARRALTHRPTYAEALVTLGNALKELGERDEATASYARALTLKPDLAEARLGLTMAVIPVFARHPAESAAAVGDFAHALDGLSAWRKIHDGTLGKAVGTSQPFYLAYRPADVTAVLCRYGDIASAEAALSWCAPVEALAVPRAPRSRTRILVISGQIRHHPVWDVVLRGILAHLDRERFEILLYHTASLTDEETAWARTRADRFVQGPMPTRDWLREVERDRPDVIFYPEVGMDPAACALAALRLAPLQVAGWGHPVTTGLPTMDLFMSGDLLEPQGAQRHYREKLVRLPGTGVCTEPAGEHLDARERLDAGVDAAAADAPGIAWRGPARVPDLVRFALCQQPIKPDPADDALLARIARAAGPSEFWLVSPHKLDWAARRLRERLAAAFRTEGLDPDAHLRVTPWLARRDFGRFLDAMDIYLDCPAFSGYTTAWQAVHRGLPIVTLEGAFMRQRLAAGLARQIGVTDGIAASRDQYADIAVRWAEECRRGGSWAARRGALRDAAPQADGNRAAVGAFAQAIDEALRACASSGT